MCTRALAATHADEAAGLVQAARAAVSFGMFPRAQVAAADALRIARDRGESRWAAEAGEILAAIRGDELTDETLARVFPDAAYEEAPEPTEAAVRLVDDLLTALGPAHDTRPAGVAGMMLDAVPVRGRQEAGTVRIVPAGSFAGEGAPFTSFPSRP